MAAMFPKLPGGAGIKEALQKAQRERLSPLNRLFNSALGSFDEADDDDDEYEAGSDCDVPVVDTPHDIKHTWRAPSANTVSVMMEIFSSLIDRQKDQLKLMMVETALTLCPPEENVLLVEDKDHYNLLQKAIIFNSLPLVNLLLNHGCAVSGDTETGAQHGGSCGISKKCPHLNLGSLHLACYLGRTDIVELLLRRGADKTESKRVYTSAVIDCPPRFQLDILSTCVSQEATDLMFRCGARLPVFFAVLGDHVDIVKMLLGVGETRESLCEG